VVRLARSTKKLSRVGALLCLDFVNTVDWRGREEPIEYLCTYDDLLEWSVAGGALDFRRARLMRGSVKKKAASVALKHAVDFREAAHRLLSAVIRKTTPASADMDLVNQTISEARVHAMLQFDRGAFSWKLAGPDNHPDVALWAVALSLADLLVSDELKHVRECGGPGCGWLFLDISKNHQRRWCSMQACGNRAKARRHYAKTA
jgi:predicted RNA-binding Zn ribbon-like protein